MACSLERKKGRSRFSRATNVVTAWLSSRSAGGAAVEHLSTSSRVARAAQLTLLCVVAVAALLKACSTTPIARSQVTTNTTGLEGWTRYLAGTTAWPRTCSGSVLSLDSVLVSSPVGMIHDDGLSLADCGGDQRRPQSTRTASSGHPVLSDGIVRCRTTSGSGKDH